MQADRTDGRSGILNRVAFTLPEGGYDLNPAPFGLRAEFADILHDVAGQGTLCTGFATKVAVSRPRCDRGVGPFTGRSVDNPRGGRANPRQNVASLERPTGPALAVWITANCSFSNSLADCIVPTTGTREPALACQLGNDAAARGVPEGSAGAFWRTIPEQGAPIGTGSGATFANHWIVDMIRRVVCDGSPRHRSRVLGVKRNAMNAGRLVADLALAEAFRARTCAGTREDGAVTGPSDPKSDNFVKTAVRASETPQAWLGRHRFFGNLADHPVFQARFARWPQMIWSDGTGAAMRARSFV